MFLLSLRSIICSSSYTKGVKGLLMFLDEERCDWLRILITNKENVPWLQLLLETPNQMIGTTGIEYDKI
jgi:hypothetical protein